MVNAEARRQALHDAAQWFARMGAAPGDHALREQWQAWHAECPQHQWAWQRLGSLQARLGTVPQQLGWEVMEQVDRQGTGLSRRNLLGGLVLGAGLGVLGWRGYQAAPLWMADLRTATGEQRHEVLADGTVLVLDTATAVDVAFDGERRLLRLRGGKLHVTTGKDPRPLIVRSAEGDMRALGTRFAVEQLAGRTRLSVYQHAVAVRADGQAGEIVVGSGRQVLFDRQRVGEGVALEAGAESWSSGRLVVEGWPLGQVIEALQRYRGGYLGCAPEVSQLRVSGTYPLNDVDVALKALELSLPVRLQRYTRFWVRVVPV